ncbi:MAG TPA: signal recognition particle-docking protein FtsY [Rickettsiales bacterium]|nr:signal recognition particle-docking protein FtsY [Rickettsiales bacterium]
MSIFHFFSKSKIKDQLKNTSLKISSSITQIFTHKKIDDKTLQELEDALISSDISVETSLRIIDELRKNKFQKDVNIQEIKEFLATQIFKMLQNSQKKINFEDNTKPKTIIFCGINGAGKTTTIGKIAFNLTNEGKKVLIAACDTFRAAASHQIEIWAKRANCEIITAQKDGEDPAAVAYRSLDYAKKNGFDILLIDTAGRLQNKQNLMDELKKICNVLKKLDANAPHENLLVIDATLGQNIKNQIELFDKIIGISGLIITKLDGSAKGGAVLGLTDKFKIPIYAIGVGEKIEDLQEFDAQNFAQNLIGV